jgi:high-affinity nickel permease
MNYLSMLGVAFLGFLLGARHGLDWDHFAAIADLVGTPGQRSRRSLALVRRPRAYTSRRLVV